MATDALLTDESNDDAPFESTGRSPVQWLKTILGPFASLKLTVFLFVLSIFLILAGTFAQVEKDIWEVIGTYFRVWMAWVPFQVFFPPSFFEEKPWQVPGGIWFPGGKTIGLLLAVNLLSAHIVRFKIVAKGSQLFSGVAAIAVGCVFTWAIIAAGGNSKGIQNDPWIPYGTQWIGYQGLLGLAVLVAGFGFVSLCQQTLAKSSERRTRQIFLRCVVAALGISCAGLLTWIILRGTAGRPSDASLRILWQLTQGAVASLALLGGCWVVFGQRAGIVLLHGGVGLMMFYELHVALTAVETQMNLAEGERKNYAHDIRTSELAITDVTDPLKERVVVIPKSIYLSGKTIDQPDLPFKIDVDKDRFVQNARLRSVKAKEQNPATTGLGLTWFPQKIAPGAGTDNDSKIDMPAAFVTLTSKSDGKPLGTYLASMEMALGDEADTVQQGDKIYRIELRPKRYYKNYVFELKDVRKEDYLGTSTPRNFASTVHISDSDLKVDDEKTIWMNNPLRFENETFYQSGYFVEPGTGIEHTTLSVVANSGWMMPYVGCMLVGIGMLVHFVTMLVKFLMRGDTVELTAHEAQRTANLAAKLGMKSPQAPIAAASLPSSPWPNVFAASVALLAIVYILNSSHVPSTKLLTFDFYRFGQIPVVSEGRTKPLSTAAATSLLAITGKTSVTTGEGESKHKLPAIEWLAKVITEAKEADDLPIFRVENLEVMETIGVKKREGMRYSRNDIRAREEEFDKQVNLARSKARVDRKQLSPFERKVLELSEKVSTYDNLKFAFGLQYRIKGDTREEVLESFQRVDEFSKALEAQGQPVFAVGPTKKEEQWHMYSRAWIIDLIERIQQTGNVNKTVGQWDQILKGYSENKAPEFNKGVDELLASVDAHPPRDVTPWVIRLEAYFNHVQPFTIATVLYLMAFILGAVGWLAWPRGMNRAAFCLLVVVFCLHSSALLARLIISGRPPVTNLYSSAIFIGWGCVLLGLLFELNYRIGIGNLVAAVAGYATLLIADALAADGDTFTVLQAVLDTQFWLATHVTCITLGYATTYLAGLFGIAYILRAISPDSLTESDAHDIYRMIYGTLCFSIFFSFVGTVLGGLWADDSWGRFWGWDPKENAALIIVLWNALALHARWGGMVKERGLAALAVGGNIFVSWSWWGVNALGAGLHSYGFKAGTLVALGYFILANLAIIAIALIPLASVERIRLKLWGSLASKRDIKTSPSQGA